MTWMNETIEEGQVTHSNWRPLVRKLVPILLVLLVGYHIYDFYRVRNLTMQNAQNIQQIVEFINNAVKNSQK